MASMLNLKPPRPNGSGPLGRKDHGVDRAVRAVLGLFWIVSLVRVAGAFVRHEVLGVEATLALIALVGIPWLLGGRRGFGGARRAR